MNAPCIHTGSPLAMARRVVVAMLLPMLLPAMSAAQGEQTLLDSGITSGGFGGPTMAFTSVHGDFAVLMGARGGWIINHSFVLGGGGYGMVSQDIRTNYSAHGGQPALRLGYGGAEFTYINNWSALVHPIARLLIGGGSVTYEGQPHEGDMPSDDFFVAEPELSLEVNIVRWFRVNAGGSYRFVSGASLPGVGNGQLRAFSGTLALAFGKF